MDVGNGYQIADKYFTPIAATGYTDRHGLPLNIADPVRLFGCMSTRGIIGKTANGRPVVYFAKTCTVMWLLSKSVCKRIEKIED